MVDLEFRRGAAMWLIPLALIPLWFILRNDFTTPVSLWVETSVTIRTALNYLGPFFGGAAAWVAAREHRRGAGELLATTPLPGPGGGWRPGPGRPWRPCSPDWSSPSP
ncbi:MAG: hypothetical protein WKF80_10825 [Thermomicrobiales bacterium]